MTTASELETLLRQIVSARDAECSVTLADAIKRAKVLTEKLAAERTVKAFSVHSYTTNGLSLREYLVGQCLTGSTQLVGTAIAIADEAIKQMAKKD